MSTNPASSSPDDSDSVRLKYGIIAVALGLEPSSPRCSSSSGVIPPVPLPFSE